MGFPPHTPGFGFYSVANDVLAGLAFILGFIIVLGLLVIIVRFLLVATKAAEVYIAKNTATDPVTPVDSVVTTPLPTTPVATTTRTRTPKAPTTE